MSEFAIGIAFGIAILPCSKRTFFSGNRLCLSIRFSIWNSGQRCIVGTGIAIGTRIRIVRYFVFFVTVYLLCIYMCVFYLNTYCWALLAAVAVQLLLLSGVDNSVCFVLCFYSLCEQCLQVLFICLS